MIQQQGVCNSSLVLHRSLNLLVSFACIFRCSVAKAAEPAVCPASDTMSSFSGDDTDKSNAAGLPLIPQLLTSMSAGLDCFWSWPRPLPASSLGLYKALLKR